MAEFDFDYAAFGRRVKEVRKKLGFKQQDFAAQLGIINSYLSEIEHGKGKPTVALFDQLYRLFQVNLLYVISGKGEMFDDKTLSRINPSDQPPGYIANAEDLYWYIKNCPPMRDAVMGFAAKYFLENEEMVSHVLQSKNKESLAPPGLMNPLKKI